ncbi:MAG TPA: D-xylose transporter XylE [Rhizomicrobium sp.]
MQTSSLATRLSFVATLGGLLFGYDTAVISGAVSSIDANFINPIHLSETAKNALSGWTVSSALLGCIVGAAAAGWIARALGRRGGLILAAIFFFLSAIGSAVPEVGFGPIGGMGPHALPAFIAYRILCGVGIGIASMLSPLYIAEIAPSRIRGRLVSYNQMAIVTGILLVYFVNWAIAAQGDTAWLRTTGWRFMLGSEVVPATFFLLLLRFVPDTPRWLVIKGRAEEAKAILLRLTTVSEAEVTYREIEVSLAQTSGKLFSFGAGVVVIGILLSAFQQLVGINAVLYYAPTMFQNMGAGANAALLQTVLVGAVNMLCTLIAIFTVDRWGRKPLLIFGGLIMAIAMLTLGALFAAGSTGIYALIAILLYIGGFALSWGPVVWVLLAEMFPNAIKDKAMAVAVAAQWITNLLVSWSFRIVDGSSALNAIFHHGLAYFLYGAMSLLAVLFVWRWIPETKEKRLEEIAQFWQRGNDVPQARTP